MLPVHWASVKGKVSEQAMDSCRSASRKASSFAQIWASRISRGIFLLLCRCHNVANDANPPHEDSISFRYLDSGYNLHDYQYRWAKQDSILAASG